MKSRKKFQVSKKAEEASEILKNIMKEVKRFQELSNEMKKEAIRDNNFTQCHLGGALVIGVYSPLIEVATTTELGPEILCNALVEQLREEREFSEGFLNL